MSQPEISRAEWVKSSYSGSNEGECVEFSRTFAATGVIPVRDSKLPTGPILTLTPAAWAGLVTFAADHADER
ncbi:DUF397 domain-containing protein [Streptomyces sp. NPDC088725]|uniref:DUF397 domain-containing protein n=1 Tax=Streptomyces sp. NPDC088725 TaxID=3365873 RepID=UPI0038080001